MQADPGRDLFRMFVERIVKRAFAKESAAARLQQIGVFALIYMMERDEEPLTAARLSQYTGLTDGQVLIHLRKLVKRGLVERTKITSKHGKGRSFRLSIKHNDRTKKLVDALDGAGLKVAGEARKRR
jgi:predicted ArsR family transcriptional regulator